MPRAHSSRRWAIRPLLVAAVVLALVVVGRRVGALLPRFVEWMEALGPWGPLVYVLGYTVATVAMVPGSILTLAAGALFGLAGGTVVAFLGAATGSVAAFLVSRHAARGAVERYLAHRPRFAAVDRAVALRGRKVVFLLRLSPLVPYNVLNYVLGITRVRLGDYVIASLGMIPAEMLYVYYGKLAGDVLVLAGGAVPKGPAYYVVMTLGLIATIVVTTIITRIATRALHESKTGL